MLQSLSLSDEERDVSCTLSHVCAVPFREEADRLRERSRLGRQGIDEGTWRRSPCWNSRRAGSTLSEFERNGARRL